MYYKGKTKSEPGKIYYAEILFNNAFHQGEQKKELIKTAKRLLKNKVETKEHIFFLSKEQAKKARGILESKNGKNNLKTNYIIPILQASFLSEPLLHMYNLHIELALDGLAKRSNSLNSLSEKTVTRKVRKSLKNLLGKETKVSCWAWKKNDMWLGHGTYNWKNFNWVVMNGFFQIDTLY
jgi:hypothetical protein